MEVLAQRPTKVVYREGDFVVKEFNESYSKADVLNEALNQARVEETGLPIPKLVEVKKIDNKWAIVMEYVEGKTIAQLIGMEGTNIILIAGAEAIGEAEGGGGDSE